MVLLLGDAVPVSSRNSLSKSVFPPKIHSPSPFAEGPRSVADIVPVLFREGGRGRAFYPLHDQKTVAIPAGINIAGISLVVTQVGTAQLCYLVPFCVPGGAF
jgi:hypothetical protein